MFLQPTPPRLTRRSRLDDLLLLLLRALAICLLALAFARPFLRSEAAMTLNDIRTRRVAIVLDTSASMQRDGVWDAAVAEVENVLDELEPADDVALLSFDHRVEMRVGFGGNELVNADQQAALVQSAMQELSPTSHATGLDRALMRAAEVVQETDTDSLAAAQQIVLITDMQSGASRNSLQGFDWPEGVFVDVRAVGDGDATNASLLPIASAVGEPSTDGPRVRVSNSEFAENEQFNVRWATNSSEAEQTVTYIVPAGESRVLEVPVSDAKRDRLVLTGDEVAFDNTYFVAPAEPREIVVHYLGTDDVDDADGLLYYLSRAFVDTPTRRVRVTSAVNELSRGEPALIVVTSALEPAASEAISSHLDRGGNALVVLQSADMAKSLQPIIGELDIVTTPADEAAPNERSPGQRPPAQRETDQLLADIDFADPLFEPFANPRFNDFTDVRFWTSVPVSFPSESDVNVIARFDDRAPAIWTRTVGEGQVFVFASGWNPGSSQLALSNKFVPLLEGVLKQSLPAPLRSAGYNTGDLVTFGEPVARDGGELRRPDGETVELTAGSTVFTNTQQPGIYRLSTSGPLSSDRAAIQFAVNVPSSESELTPIGVEMLEQLGVPVGLQATQSDEFERQRAVRDRELEQQQKIWKWLIVAVLVLLAAEMAISGQRLRAIPQTEVAI